MYHAVWGYTYTLKIIYFSGIQTSLEVPYFYSLNLQTYLGALLFFYLLWGLG